MDDQNQGRGGVNTNKQFRQYRSPEEDDNHGDYHDENCFIDFFRKNEEELGLIIEQSSPDAGEPEYRSFSMHHDPDRLRAGFIDFWLKNEELGLKTDQSSSKSAEVETKVLNNKGAVGKTGHIGSSSSSHSDDVNELKKSYWLMNKAEVERELCKYGKVKQVSEFCLEFILVEFSNQAGARACKKGMHGHRLNGRDCEVTFEPPFCSTTVRLTMVDSNHQIMAQTCTTWGNSRESAGRGQAKGVKRGRGASAIRSGGTPDLALRMCSNSDNPYASKRISRPIVNNMVLPRPPPFVLRATSHADEHNTVGQTAGDTDMEHGTQVFLSLSSVTHDTERLNGEAVNRPEKDGRMDDITRKRERSPDHHG